MGVLLPDTLLFGTGDVVLGRPSPSWNSLTKDTIEHSD